jgi:hypothetical protein
MGAYKYALSGSSFETGAMYLFVATTTDTSVDQQYIYALWIADTSWVVFLDRALSVIESNIRGADYDTIKTIMDYLLVMRGGTDTLGSLSDQIDTVSLEGDTPVNFTVSDAGGGVSDFRIEIYDSGGHYKTHGRTNGSGVYSKNLVYGGVYTAKPRKDGFTAEPVSFTVDSNPKEVAISATAISITPASLPNTCTLYVQLTDYGTPPAKVDGSVRIITPKYISGVYYSGDRKAPDSYNFESGVAEFRNVPWYAEVEVRIRSDNFNIHKTGKVKPLSTMNIYDL